MKVLLDSCIAGKARKELEEVGHDVVWAGDWSEDPGDEALLAAAHNEGRVLVTLDKDFGELAVLGGASHSGLLRLVNFPVGSQASACIQVLARYGEELRQRAIITAEPGRIRIRKPS